MQNRPWYVIRPFVSGVCGVTVAAMLANELHGYATLAIAHVRNEGAAEFSWPNLLYCAVLIALLIVMLVWWHDITKSPVQSRTRYFRRQIAKDDPRSHLVYFLSNVIFDDPSGKNTAKSDGSPLHVELTRDLEADLIKLAEAGRPYWPWEQLLRAAQAHGNELRKVFIVGSVQSLPQMPRLKPILERYAQFTNVRFHQVVRDRDSIVVKPLGEKLGSSQTGFDFENYDELSNGIRALIKELRERYGAANNSIVIDFTGGQKVTSVVAVAETLDMEIAAQYVQTDGTKTPFLYDVVTVRATVDHPWTLPSKFD